MRFVFFIFMAIFFLGPDLISGHFVDACRILVHLCFAALSLLPHYDAYYLDTELTSFTIRLLCAMMLGKPWMTTCLNSIVLAAVLASFGRLPARFWFDPSDPCADTPYMCWYTHL